MNFLELLTSAAAVAGAVIAILTAIQLATSGINYLVTVPARYRRWRRGYKYVIIPTLEEIAKYSEKIPDKWIPSPAELRLEKEKARYERVDAITKVRVQVVMIAFVLLYAVFIARTIQFAIM